jgi:hypothetical protein
MYIYSFNPIREQYSQPQKKRKRDGGGGGGGSDALDTQPLTRGSDFLHTNTTTSRRTTGSNLAQLNPLLFLLSPVIDSEGGVKQTMSDS